MKVRGVFAGGVFAVAAVVALSIGAQETTGGRDGTGARGRFRTPAAQVVAIKAGRLFDSRTGTLLTGQTILIRGERIAEIGANVNVPRDARVIDLGNATVMPGMIDAHVHVNTTGNRGGGTPAERAYIALASAQTDLLAGFTTVADMDSRGGFNTVDLRDSINSGMVLGPRMQVVGQSLNLRASTVYQDESGERFYSGFTEGKNVNSPWLARAAVREAKLHGVDWVKIYTSQDFEGPYHLFMPDGNLIATPSLTSEEVEAITDEAHRLGLKVACHTYGGEGMRSCLNAGVDAPTHLLELDDAGVKVLLEKKLPFVCTLDDLILFAHASGNLNPLMLPRGEVLPALQNKAIDGATAIHAVFIPFKYYDVAKTATYVPKSFVVASGLVNRKWMKSLGPELEAIVREEARRHETLFTSYGVPDTVRLKEAWEKNGGENITLPPDEAAKFLDAVGKVVPTVTARNAKFKEDYDAFVEAAKKHR